MTLCMVLGAAAPATAQGRINNAKTETRSAAHGLDREVRGVASRGGLAWIGYRMPMVAGPRQMCCFDTWSSANPCCGTCRLEGAGGVFMASGDFVTRGSRIALEPPSEFLVLARIENGAVVRVRTFTPDCDVDAGGMTLVWLNDVTPADSVTWLSALMSSSAATGDRRGSVANAAMSAIALHDLPAADRVLVAAARNDTSRWVRGQALFWLAWRAGREAMATIAGAIDDDPDAEVRRRAVFALSQLPKDEGVPKLIELARTNRHPEVRKQAMFWLGQSDDPRALKFFEDVLLR